MPFRPLEISRIYLIGIVSHIDTYTCLLASNEWNDLVIEFTGSGALSVCRFSLYGMDPHGLLLPIFELLILWRT